MKIIASVRSPLDEISATQNVSKWTHQHAAIESNPTPNARNEQKKYFEFYANTCWINMHFGSIVYLLNGGKYINNAFFVHDGIWTTVHLRQYN